MAEIKQFFGQFIELLNHPASYSGCLIINTAVEVKSHDESVEFIVQQYFDRLRQGFDRALRNAKQNGEIAVSTNISQVTEFLVGSVLGLTTYARLPVPRKDVQSFVRGVLATLEHL
jgi:TetR/AcrR family transcriptional regulator, transcriptional repressor for nem operon